MQKCPGQDTRFWTPDDVTEVPCADCGFVVEFFKTDGARPCPKCGAKVTNPHLSLGCAQWCSHARECLGFDPKDVQVRSASKSSLAGRLVEEAKNLFGADSPQFLNALAALEKSGEILKKKGGDPKIVIASTFINGLADAENSYNPAKAVDIDLVRTLMTKAGFDDATVERVCESLKST